MMDAAAQIEALRTALAKAEARADAIAAEAAQAKAAAAHAQALVSGSEALIAHLRLEIEKLRRELYGQRSERKQRLLEQMELQLEEMEATASEDACEVVRACPDDFVQWTKSSRSRPVGRWPRRQRPRPRPRSAPSSGASRCASPFPSICRASGSCCPRRAAVLPAAPRGWQNWARMSPRHWRSFRGSGR